MNNKAVAPVAHLMFSGIPIIKNHIEGIAQTIPSIGERIITVKTKSNDSFSFNLCLSIYLISTKGIKSMIKRMNKLNMERISIKLNIQPMLQKSKFVKGCFKFVKGFAGAMALERNMESKGC